VVAVGFALVPSSIVSHIVGERVNNQKHMQVLSGLSLPAYWISNLLFDISKGLIPAGIAIGLLYAFNLNVSAIKVTSVV
jgi:ATP-binding cassette subfamily A (ABC1) protein 3